MLCLAQRVGVLVLVRGSHEFLFPSQNRSRPARVIVESLHRHVSDHLGVASVVVVIGGSMSGILSVLECPPCVPPGFMRHGVSLRVRPNDSVYTVAIPGTKTGIIRSTVAGNIAARVLPNVSESPSLGRGDPYSLHPVTMEVGLEGIESS